MERFDEDRHCEGATILWEIATIKRQGVEEITRESHGQPLVLLKNRKRNKKIVNKTFAVAKNTRINVQLLVKQKFDKRSLFRKVASNRGRENIRN